MNAVLLALLLFSGEPEIVVEDVDTIGVVHVQDGAELLFVFGFVQGEWTCLDHRWLASEMTPGREGESFTLAWHDDGDSCYRLLRAKRWIETWTNVSPLAEHQGRPWFARLLCPGLKQPQVIKP